MQNGWRLKRLHKLILTSTAYRQRSTRNRALDAIDPDNRLLARQNLHRLDAEALRVALEVACELYATVRVVLEAPALGPRQSRGVLHSTQAVLV